MASFIRVYSKCFSVILNQSVKSPSLFRKTILNHSHPNNSRHLNISKIYNNDAVPIVVYPPTFPESVTDGDIQWQKNVGDFVKEDELIGEIETDKTSLPVRSPTSGKITELFVKNGSKVKKTDQLLSLLPSAVPKAEITTSKESKISKDETKPVIANKDERVHVQPVNTNISSDTISVPNNSKIGSEQTLQFSNERSETRVKMPKIRQTIANRLKESQNTYAMLTTFNEVDMSNLVELRQKYQNDFLKSQGVKLGFMSTFICAAANALKNLPSVNAVIDKNEIVYRDYIDISVAVATPKGLVVPVIRNVQKMNYANIEATLNQLSEKARNNQLALEDMDGGTFTISNGGVFGSLMGTPIINPPQSAVLGMHAIVDRPVAISGKVEIRPMMYVALTYDHRLIDGREAVTFLKKIKSYVEDPRLIVMGL